MPCVILLSTSPKSNPQSARLTPRWRTYVTEKTAKFPHTSGRHYAAPKSWAMPGLPLCPQYPMITSGTYLPDAEEPCLLTDWGKQAGKTPRKLSRKDLRKAENPNKPPGWAAYFQSYWRFEHSSIDVRSIHGNTAICPDPCVGNKRVRQSGRTRSKASTIISWPSSYSESCF